MFLSEDFIQWDHVFNSLFYIELGKTKSISIWEFERNSNIFNFV